MIVRKLPTIYAATLVSAQYLRYRYAGIIITDTVGNKSEKLKRSDMSFEKGLCAFAGKCHHEHGVRMDKAHHKEYDLFQCTVEVCKCMTKVNLCFTGSLT